MKNLFYLTLFLLAFTSCEKEDDDEYGMPLVYAVCGAEFTFSASDRTNLKVLSVAEIPSSIRSHIAAEFVGIQINQAVSFQTNSDSFIEVTANNNGKLLFDNEGIFVCGDNSFQAVGGDDDDDYISVDALPQKIKDYAAEHYPNATIRRAKIKNNEYKIKLSNGKELYFDLEGNFLREE